MDCIYYYLCNNKNEKSDLKEHLINNDELIKLNCFFIKTKITNNIYTIDIFRSKIGRNIPKFLPIELSDLSVEFLICIDAMFDIKKLCDELNYSYNYMRTIEVNINEYNNSYIILYDYVNQKFKLQKMINLKNSINK
jgi:hypothetical protein